jgi:hypothetical protein
VTAEVVALLEGLQRLHADMVNVALYGTDEQRADLRLRIALLGADVALMQQLREASSTFDKLCQVVWQA